MMRFLGINTVHNISGQYLVLTCTPFTGSDCNLCDDSKSDCTAYPGEAGIIRVNERQDKTRL
jgi:hypothetical protein